MPAESPHSTRAPNNVIVEANDTRDVGPAEAERLLAECVNLTRKNLSTAFWRALEDLQAATQIREGASLAPTPAAGDTGLSASVRQQRRHFFPRFLEVYEGALQRRVRGEARQKRRDGGDAVTLALVNDVEVVEQVALKKAVRAMNDEVREEKFALDLRVRAMLREPPEPGPFDNPWGVRYLCDALGTVCRELWHDNDRWRPIMLHLVEVATPQVLSLYRELNGYLQDCDILPQVRVRMHGRGGKLYVQQTAKEDLFSTLVEQFASAADGAAPAHGVGLELEPAAGGSPGPHAASGPGGGATAGHPGAGTGPPAASDHPGALGDHGVGQELLSTMQHAPTLDALIGILVSFLQAQATAGYGSAPLTWFVGEAPPHGAARIAGPGELQLSMPQAAQPAADRPINAVRLARGTLLQRAGSSPDRAVIEIIAGLMDYIFDEPCLSDAVKALFARLQIPLLKAALADHSVFSHARHPARRFIDTLGRALIGLRAGDAQSDAMIGLAHALVDKITNDFEDDLDVFSAAKHELDAHLDLEHALLNERLADAIPPLMWKEARTLARDRVQEQVSLQLTGRRVPIVVHRVLTHEWLDYLTDRYIDYGSESIEWTQELGLIDDLLWSLGPAAAQDQQRLRRLVPKLVKAFSGGAAMDAIAEPWRRVVLDTMFACHIGSIRQPRGTTAAGMPSELPVAPSMAAEPEAVDGQVHALARGDWCEFRADPVTKPVLARLAWRSPHRTQLLFTHRDGTTAFVHSPVSLSVEFAAGRTVVAVEDVPLCERAMRQLVAAHAQPQAH